MTDETYNGWANYETWAANLHWSNNEGDYRLWTETAEEVLGYSAENPESPSEADRNTAIGDLADMMSNAADEIRDYVHSDRTAEDHPARLFMQDVGSLWRVEWFDIAEHWIDAAIEAYQS